MIPACQIMQDIIIYESEKNFDYKTFGVSTKLMRDKAYKLISNKKLKRSSGGRFEYVRDDDVELLKLLKSKDANFDIVNRCGKTALDCTAMDYAFEAYKYLLQFVTANLVKK